MSENFFALPPMTYIKYHKFLEVKQKYDIKEIKESVMSFVPAPEFIPGITVMFGKSTDFLHCGIENEVDMIVAYPTFLETIKKAETARFMSDFVKTVEWRLQIKEM